MLRIFKPWSTLWVGACVLCCAVSCKTSCKEPLEDQEVEIEYDDLSEWIDEEGEPLFNCFNVCEIESDVSTSDCSIVEIIPDNPDLGAGGSGGFGGSAPSSSGTIVVFCENFRPICDEHP